MEVRSSRRMRTLVTQWPDRGLSANENARALISMMARSTTHSNQRPDTLMQDRHRQFDEIFLQRTAGPYIRVKSRKTQCEHMFSALPPNNGHRATTAACPSCAKLGSDGLFDHLIGARQQHWRNLKRRANAPSDH